MKALPKNLKLLREIGQILDQHLASQKTYVEFRSTDLYELVIRSEMIYREFPDKKTSNRFLRESHHNNTLGIFIAYRVDTSIHEMYQWHFRRKNGVKSVEKKYLFKNHFIKVGNQERMVRSISVSDYYPLKTYPIVSDRRERFRKLIWKFKDGQNFPENDKIQIRLKILLQDLSPVNLNDYILIPVPASNVEKTALRYSRFMPELAKRLDKKLVLNAITSENHEPNKGSLNNRIEHFTFFPENYRGKGVILFDDIITSGKTFEQTSARLLDTGAINVIGLFLGRTVSKHDQ